MIASLFYKPLLQKGENNLEAKSAGWKLFVTVIVCSYSIKQQIVITYKISKFWSISTVLDSGK